jgi:hypothetical protein
MAPATDHRAVCWPTPPARVPKGGIVSDGIFKRWMSKPVAAFCAAVPSFLCCGSAAAADAELEAVRARVEGIYSLEEWHTATGVFRPPQIEGRATIKNGTIIFIIHDRMKASPQTTIATYGMYVLTSKEFAYRYVEPSVFTIDGDKITVSHKVPWEGLRHFDVVREGVNVRFKAQAGAQEFLFTPEGHSYSDGAAGDVGKRVWRRIPAE